MEHGGYLYSCVAPEGIKSFLCPPSSQKQMVWTWKQSNELSTRLWRYKKSLASQITHLEELTIPNIIACRLPQSVLPTSLGYTYGIRPPNSKLIIIVWLHQDITNISVSLTGLPENRWCLFGIRALSCQQGCGTVTKNSTIVKRA
jgi:hypothetical protein